MALVAVVTTFVSIATMMVTIATVLVSIETSILFAKNRPLSVILAAKSILPAMSFHTVKFDPTKGKSKQFVRFLDLNRSLT